MATSTSYGVLWKPLSRLVVSAREAAVDARPDPAIDFQLGLITQ